MKKVLHCHAATPLQLDTFPSLVWYKIDHTVARKVVHAFSKYFKDFQSLLELRLHQTSHLKEENGLHVRFEDVSWSNTRDSWTKVKMVWSA